MLKKRTIFRIANILLGITSKGLEIVDCRFFAKTAASSAAAKRWGCSRAGLGLLLDALARDDRDVRVLFGSRVKKKNAAPIAEPHSLPMDIGSLSAREIELSEDYTCVISHGPNPKTVHIFGDCVLESLPASHWICDKKILLDEETEKEPTTAADNEMFLSE